MTKAEAVNKLLAWAVSQIGYHEGASNWNKYAEDPDLAKLLGWKAQKEPWCDVFTDEGFIACFGLKAASAMTYQPIGKGSAACRYSAQFFKDNGAFVKTPEPGDVVFFYDKAKAINHQGFVEKVSGGLVQTIEGNKSDEVQRCVYAVGSSVIAGYGRPKWSAVAANDEVGGGDDEVVVIDTSATDKLPMLRKGMVGSVVAAAQALLILRKCSCGVYGADGDFGNATEAACLAFQRRNGLEADGVIGPQTWAKLLGVS